MRTFFFLLAVFFSVQSLSMEEDPINNSKQYAKTLVDLKFAGLNTKIANKGMQKALVLEFDYLTHVGEPVYSAQEIPCKLRKRFDTFASSTDESNDVGHLEKEDKESEKRIKEFALMYTISSSGKKSLFKEQLNKFAKKMISEENPGYFNNLYYFVKKRFGIGLNNINDSEEELGKVVLLYDKHGKKLEKLINKYVRACNKPVRKPIFMSISSVDRMEGELAIKMKKIENAQKAILQYADEKDTQAN